MSAPTPFPQRIDRYQIQGLAGRGGMARVYKAWDPKHQRVVALKLMNPELRQDAAAVRRFRVSARTLYQLRHENIMRVFGADDEDGVPYLVLEYIDGYSLDRLLVNGQPMPPRQVVQVIDQVSRALDHAHVHGVVHRDIKPSNILLARDGQRAVLSDFGLALVLGQARLTLPGVTLGTPRYMAPEQIRNTNVDWRADIYALGVTCYELLTGQPAFYGKWVEMGAAIVNGHYRPPSQVNPALPLAVDGVLRYAMELRPERRYQRATQFAQALRGALGLAGGSPTPQPRQITASSGRTASAPRWLMILTWSLVVLVALAALLWLAIGRA